MKSICLKLFKFFKDHLKKIQEHFPSGNMHNWNTSSNVDVIT